MLGMRQRLLAVLGLAAAAFGQTENHPENWRRILDEARIAPVEIFADVAFRLLKGNRIPDPNKLELLEEIFRRAGEAREAVPLRFAGMGMAVDRANDTARAHELGFDSLSLRSKAITALLTVDPAAARRLFEEMPRVEYPKPTCGSAFAPAPGPYFELLALVVQTGPFTALEREKRVPLRMAEAAVRSITVSSEIQAAAKALPRLIHDDLEAKTISSALAAALEVSDSDRGFAGAVRTGDLVREVLFANTKLKDLGASDLPVLAALRTYLVRHLTGVRCEDTIEEGTPGAEKDGPYAVQIFNTTVAGREDVQQIAPEERRGSKVGGKASSPEYANDPEFRRMQVRIAVTQTRNRLASIQLPGPEWNHQVHQFLSEIQDLRGVPGQNPVEVFHQKMRLLAEVTESPLSGDSALAVTAAAAHVLEDSTMVRNSPVQWLAALGDFLRYQEISPHLFDLMDKAMQTLAKRTGRLSPEIVVAIPVSPAEISERLAASQVSALSLYGRIWLLSHKPR